MLVERCIIVSVPMNYEITTSIVSYFPLISSLALNNFYVNRLSQKHALRLLQMSLDYVQESDSLASVNNSMIVHPGNVHHLNT